MNGIKRELRHTNWKFNNEKDFIDYSITFYCNQSYERIKNAFSKLTDEIGQILEEDRELYKKKEDIPGGE